MKTTHDDSILTQAEPVLARRNEQNEFLFLMNHLSCVQENLPLFEVFHSLTKNKV